MILTAAGAAGCPSATGAGLVLIGVGSALLSMAVLRVASSYPPTRRIAHLVLGRVLLLAGAVAAVVGATVTIFAGRSDSCGRYYGAAADAGGWLTLGGLLAVVLGVVLAYAAEWAAAAIVAIIDPTAAAILSAGAGSHRGAMVVLFGTHGVCASVAACWSWRARGRTPAARAKASEAARHLTSAWLILGLLIMASRGQPAPGTGRLLTDSALVTVFVITAITAVTGAGYTKYVEAMATEPEGPIPRAEGKVGDLRDHTIRLWGQTAATVTRYHESFSERIQALRARSWTASPRNEMDDDSADGNHRESAATGVREQADSDQ